MKKPGFYHLQDVISVIKENKTEVSYYLFDEYEIHLNKIPCHSMQEWHYHTHIQEVILVIKGQLKCLWMVNNQKYQQTVYEKELVVLNDAIHTLMNDTNEKCEFVVFRLVLEGKDKRNIFLNDKTIIKDI